jgi:hypothetical protein
LGASGLVILHAQHLSSAVKGMLHAIPQRSLVQFVALVGGQVFVHDLDCAHEIEHVRTIVAKS